MVKTTIKNLKSYANLQSRFTAAFSALEARCNQPFGPGRQIVQGDEIYINAFEYDTKPAEDALMEAHRRYIDIMLVCDGEEQIAVKSVQLLTDLVQAYDAARDDLLAKAEGSSTMLCMHPGDVAIFFPEDAHAPGITLNGTSHVRKMVAKVLLDQQF